MPTLHSIMAVLIGLSAHVQGRPTRARGQLLLSLAVKRCVSTEGAGPMLPNLHLPSSSGLSIRPQLR